MDRIQRARYLARLELTIALLASGVTAFLFFAAPSFFGSPMDLSDEPPPFLTGQMVTSGFGIAGIIFGLVWMVRIYRADPEPDQRNWLYRSR
ncbi:MAG: hypothetical protein AABZ33_04535 [Chloroflexota bacterium]